MKNRLLIVLLIALPFVEVAATVYLTSWLGAIVTYSLFAIPTVAGLFIQWRRWPRMRSQFNEVLAEVKATGETKPSDPREKWGSEATYRDWTEVLAFWVATVLLFIPGFVTDAVAFALMLPWVRERLFPSPWRC